MDIRTQTPVALFEQQLREGARRLRFLPELETAYLAERADAIVQRRLALIGAAVVLVAIAPLLNAFVLHPPAAFSRPALIAQFGVMIPALVVAALVTGTRRLRRWQDPVAAIVAAVISQGLLYQRHIGAALGFAVPIELVSVVLLGTAVLGGLRLVWFLPAVVAIVTAFGVNEVGTFGATPSTLNAVVAMAMMAILATIGSYMEEAGSRAEWLHRRLAEEMAVHDALTGLSNARSFRELFPRLHAAAARDGKPLLVAMIDIDYFKNYNDHYGHIAGDDCLRRVAHVLPILAKRATDLQARIGGEEFALVWYDVDPKRGQVLLERLRDAVEQLKIPHAARPTEPRVVTISVGAAYLEAGAAETPASLLDAADRLLYRSKEAGRNRVTATA